MLEEKIDKLKRFSRRDNLKFFNIPQSTDEDYETCVMKVVSILQDTVPNRQWCRGDIVRARHRLGSNTSDKSRNGFSKLQPVIVKFTRWSDKMDILTKGREALKKKGVTVAGDLTTKQQDTIREHRERGLRAYYKGNRLVMAGPLQYHPLNRGSFADAARRGSASHGRLNPGDGRHTACQQWNPGTNVRHQSTRPREEYDSRPYQSELRRQLPLEQRNATLGRQQDHRLAERIPGEHRQPPLRPMDPAILHQREFQGLALGMVRSAALPRLAGLRPSPQRLPVARHASQELQEPHTSGGTERRRHQPPGKTA